MTSSKNSSASVSSWLVAVLLILVAVLLFQQSNRWLSPLYDPNAEPRAVTPRGNLSEVEQSTIQIFHTASPSVVHVVSTAVAQDQLTRRLYEIPQGMGSGFVWDQQGHIVTNYHVVRSSPHARVTLADGSTWEAIRMGADPDKDLAVLKIDAEAGRLKPIPIGSSNDLQVGQQAFAIGYPFGRDQTLTTGVISALGQEILSVTERPIQDVIQTDAAINPGNSGGPLLDSAGRLIGINAAIYSPTGSNVGIGYAVPVDTVNRIVPRLIRSGRVNRPGLGVAIFSDAEVSSLYERGLLPKKGVLIRDVLPKGAAEQAELRPTRLDSQGNVSLGDLIVAIDGQRVEEYLDLFRIMDNHQVGDSVAVTVWRNGREVTVDVTAQALPPPTRPQ